MVRVPSVGAAAAAAAATAALGRGTLGAHAPVRLLHFGPCPFLQAPLSFS